MEWVYKQQFSISNHSLSLSLRCRTDNTGLLEVARVPEVTMQDQRGVSVEAIGTTISELHEI